MTFLHTFLTWNNCLIIMNFVVMILQKIFFLYNMIFCNICSSSISLWMCVCSSDCLNFSFINVVILVLWYLSLSFQERYSFSEHNKTEQQNENITILLVAMLLKKLYELWWSVGLSVKQFGYTSTYDISSFTQLKYTYILIKN